MRVYYTCWHTMVAIHQCMRAHGHVSAAMRAPASAACNRSLAPRLCLPACSRDMASKYNIKYFYDITDRSNFKANPDYKGVCHVALAQVRAEGPPPRMHATPRERQLPCSPLAPGCGASNTAAGQRRCMAAFIIGTAPWMHLRMGRACILSVTMQT